MIGMGTSPAEAWIGGMVVNGYSKLINVMKVKFYSNKYIGSLFS